MAAIALPDEIWQLIFANLEIRPELAPDPRDNRPHIDALLSCMRVSRTLNSVAEPVLYQAIDVRLCSLYNLLQLVVRIACDARLGMMVKCISMEEDVNESLPMGTISDESMQNIAKVALARRHMEPLGVMSVFGIWRSALDHVGNDDWTGSYAVISLLVILSPNLESMDVDLAVCQRVIPLLSLIRPQCLTRVVARLDADPEECMGETIPNVERYLELPGLHSLRTDSMPSSHRGLTFSGFSTELRSSLKHLYFKETHMGTSDIKMVLIACPQLLTLYMTLGEGASDGYCPEMYETVCAIQAHGQQLQELAIVAHGISGESRRSWRQIESFHQFDNLRFLALPVELLIPQFAHQDYADEPFLRAGGRAILDAFQAEDDRETTRPVDYHYEVSRMPSEISRMNRRLSRDAYRAHTDGTMRVLAELFPPGLESLAILYEDKPEPFYLLRDDHQVETVLQAQALPALHTTCGCAINSSPPHFLTMASILRQIVAGPRARHPEAGLDLCYVTDTIIATSGPSGTYPQIAYRNPLKDLVSFLDSKHAENWAIWEFRAEGTGYPDDEVYGRIRHYPWPDHHPPPFALIPLIMGSMRNWLKDKDAEGRVVVVHCKAGKGRSGTVTCSYLISEEGWKAEDAKQRFTERRMRPGFGAGISIPSQIRTIEYVDRWTQFGKKYVERPAEVLEVHVWGLRDGVKIAVEGYVEEGKMIKSFHTFTNKEREIVRGGTDKAGDMSDVVAQAMDRKGALKDSSDSGASSPTTPSSSSFDRSSTTKTLDSTEGGDVIFRPSTRIVLPSSDINIDFERRNKTKFGGFTMVTSVAHVWFNIFFEGRGP
ncbi:Telomerase protein component 1 [Oleoguttula sp. CCFEE 5521]